MAVYDRTYHGYEGPITPTWSRFSVISRYALQEVMRSRLFIAFFAVCFLPMLVATIIIYLRYNVEAMSILNLSVPDIIKIDRNFFYYGVVVPQTFLSMVLILLVGPSLISSDLRNNSLPLYLSRPVNKTDYVVGKLAVLLGLAGAVTLVPSMFLFSLQAALARGPWIKEFGGLGPGLLIGFSVWITVLSVYALAVSAWVKWKPFARIVFLGSILITAAVGNVFKLLYESWWGSIFVLNDLMIRIWDQLLGRETSLGVPWAVAWLCLGSFVVLSLFMLFRRIRAFEVVS